MAAIRPLITAGPMARARRPPKVAESIVVSAAWMTPVPVQITAVRTALAACTVWAIAPPCPAGLSAAA